MPGTVQNLIISPQLLPKGASNLITDNPEEINSDDKLLPGRSTMFIRNVGREKGREAEEEKGEGEEFILGVKIYNLPFLCPLFVVLISKWIKENKFKFEQILKSTKSYVIMMKSKTHLIICHVPASFAISTSPGLSH